MDAGAVAAALEEARFDARQASRHEDLADDVRGPAELAEWERIEQLLAAAAPGTVYDPDADDVVQAELAADAAAATGREAELREAARVAARADELQALRELGTLEQTELREGDEAARDELTRAGRLVRAAGRRRLARPRPGRVPRGTTGTRPPARPPPICCRRICSPTPRCSPNSRTSRRAPASTSWRSRPGSPPPPRPPASSPRSSPAPGLGKADLNSLTAAADIG